MENNNQLIQIDPKEFLQEFEKRIEEKINQNQDNDQ